MATDRVSTALAARLSQGRTTALRLAGNSHENCPEFLSDNRGAAVVSTGLRVLDGEEAHAIKRGSVIDIVGVSSSGKTKLLHSIVAHALASPLPQQPLRPRVCWFDLNGGLDVNFLQKILARRLSRRDQEYALNALRVYRPSATVAMCKAISHLPKYFCSPEGCDGELSTFQPSATNCVSSLFKILYADCAFSTILSLQSAR